MLQQADLPLKMVNGNDLLHTFYYLLTNIYLNIDLQQ